MTTWENKKKDFEELMDRTNRRGELWSFIEHALAEAKEAGKKEQWKIDLELHKTTNDK